MLSERTFDLLKADDLAELWRRSKIELERWLFCSGSPRGKYAIYEDRLLLVCLAQGAAQHFSETQPDWLPNHEVEVDHNEIEEKGFKVTPEGLVLSGVKDLDVIFFFREEFSCKIPDIKHCRYSRTHMFSTLGERHVDWLKKAISTSILSETDEQDQFSIAHVYLQKTKHGKQYLSKKALVGLWPDAIFGQVLWSSRRLTTALIRTGFSVGAPKSACQLR